MTTASIRLWAMALGLIVAAAASAADTPPSSAANDKLATARAHIAARAWTAAVDELKQVDDTRSADWNNLMGYSLRQGAAPDLVAAERYYDEALRIDPKHRAALEYAGELHLMTGNLDKAEARLTTLDKVCRLPCEEYTDLKNAVARYKRNGNRYVAE